MPQELQTVCQELSLEEGRYWRGPAAAAAEPPRRPRPPRRPYPPTYAPGPIRPMPPGSPNVATFLSLSSSLLFRPPPPRRPPPRPPRASPVGPLLPEDNESKNDFLGLYAVGSLSLSSTFLSSPSPAAAASSPPSAAAAGEVAPGVASPDLGVAPFGASAALSNRAF